MGLARITGAGEFISNAKAMLKENTDAMAEAAADETAREIIAALRLKGDSALRHYTKLFDRDVPERFEVPPKTAEEALESLRKSDPLLVSSLEFASDNIRRFSTLQKEQLKDFELEISPGLFTGQRLVPISRAAVYVPGGRFPLISSALMGLIPAAVAGVEEKILVSPPMECGLPDKRILAAAYLAGADRYFSIGGAQAIAALALGTESVPRADFIAGPGNKFVTAAKRLLYGEVGIDFTAGPTDLLIVYAASQEPGTQKAAASQHDAAIIAADMLAQAEHDPDARARLLVPDSLMAEAVLSALDKRLSRLPSPDIARASLETGGLIIVYNTKEEAIKIANMIAPEHLELHVPSSGDWIPFLKNYGSLFIGLSSAEVLGDYSAGLNHVLPTSTSSRFSGGLSVRHFLKTLTSLRCKPCDTYTRALKAAETIALAEGLKAHAESAVIRLTDPVTGDSK